MTLGKGKQPPGYTYPYARKALMVDAVVFGIIQNVLHGLFILRDEEPYRDWWALPGGHLEIEETCEEAVSRELVEESGFKHHYFEQLHTFSKRGRDPREPTVSVAYYALVRPEEHKLKAGTDAKEARWLPVSTAVPLAFDHAEILEMAIQRMRKEVWEKPLVGALMPEQFTMGQLRLVYEQLLGTSVDPSNFRRDMLRTGFLKEIQRRNFSLPGRPVKMFRFQK